MILQCPHCGSEKGYYTLNDYKEVPISYSFDGAVIEVGFERRNISNVHKYAYCIKCDCVISTLKGLKKKQIIDIQKNPIAVYRKKKGLTQAKLADYLGCARTTVAYWECKGAKPQKDIYVQRMIELFGAQGFIKAYDAYYKK